MLVWWVDVCRSLGAPTRAGRLPFSGVPSKIDCLSYALFSTETVGRGPDSLLILGPASDVPPFRAYRALDRGAPRRGCDAADSDEEKGQFSSSEGELEPCSAKRRNCQERTPTTKRRRDKGDGDNRKHAGLEVDSYDRG